MRSYEVCFKTMGMENPETVFVTGDFLDTVSEYEPRSYKFKAYDDEGIEYETAVVHDVIWIKVVTY